MPVQSSRNKGLKATQLKKDGSVDFARSRRKKRWTWGVAATLVVAIFVVVVIVQNGGIMPEQKMADYLKDKYGKEFVVENYRIEGSGLGVEGDPHADAYPKGNSRLRFDIRDQGSYKVGQHVYYDEYIEALWIQEERKWLDRSLSEVLGYLPEYSLDIHSSVGNHQVVSFDEAVKKFSKKINYSLRIKSRESMDRLDKRLFAEQYLRIIELVRGKNVHVLLSYSVSVSDKEEYGVIMVNDELTGSVTVGQVLERLKLWRIS